MNSTKQSAEKTLKTLELILMLTKSYKSMSNQKYKKLF